MRSDLPDLPDPAHEKHRSDLLLTEGCGAFLHYVALIQPRVQKAMIWP